MNTKIFTSSALYHRMASDINIIKKEDEVLPTYTDHDGYLMPKGFPVEGFVSGLQYKAGPDDLFIATYPKCGTTWMQHIVYLILNNGKPLPAEKRLTNEFPHLEEVGAKFVSKRPISMGGYRLIKTHLPYSKTPFHPKAKYINVIRNPKDCVVSFYHHTRGFEKHYNFGSGSFDTYFRLFSEGKVDFGDYFSCTRSWFDQRNQPNVLLLTYEYVRTNTREAILKLADFIGKDYRLKLLSNDEKILNLVLEHSTLDNMKKDALRWCSSRPKHHTPFIRNGSIGKWNELLTTEQSNILDQKMEKYFTKEELTFLGNQYMSCP